MIEGAPIGRSFAFHGTYYRLHDATYGKVSITVVLGSSIFTDLIDQSIAKVIGSILAFTSALLVSLQTFLHPEKAAEGHRSIGNRYIEVTRACELLIARHSDQLVSLQEASTTYEELLAQYHSINREAESFPTSKADFAHAKAQSDTKIT